MLTIEEIKAEFSKRKIRFAEENTSGNYDDKGNLIAKSIPTLTTEFCELGFYKDTAYFVFIAESSSWSSSFYSALKSISNIQLYGFKDFKKNYELGENIDEEIKKDTYFQIQVTFDEKVVSSTDLLKAYDEICTIFTKYSVRVVNQLDVSVT